MDASKTGVDKVWGGIRVVVKTRRLRVMAAVVMVSVLVFLLVFSARASWRDNYRHEDNPKEMLDYAQISYDVSKVLKQIEDLARETGKGKDLKITVDNDFWWPLAAWYLRDYKVEGYSGSGQPHGDVLLLASAHENTAKPYLDKYDDGQIFHYLIWFPTIYTGVWPMSPDDGQGWRGWWHYLTSRKTNLDYWNSQGIAYFPKAEAVK